MISATAVIADPVLALAEHQAIKGVVRGVGSSAIHLDFDGFVVTVTGRGAGLMPNGIGVADPLPAAVTGSPVRLAPGGVGDGRWRVAWNPEAPPTWNPRLSTRADPDAIATRGLAILAALGITEPGPTEDEALVLLLRSVAERDACLAGVAAERLIGRGPGLTPEGDDALTAVAVMVAAVAGWEGEQREAWLKHAVPSGLRSRTTALSATLLELAREGCAIEPLHRLFDLGPRGELGWPSALRSLMRTGSTTGPTYAVASASAAVLGSRTHERN
jgi:hypothetical protein